MINPEASTHVEQASDKNKLTIGDRLALFTAKLKELRDSGHYSPKEIVAMIKKVGTITSKINISPDELVNQVAANAISVEVAMEMKLIGSSVKDPVDRSGSWEQEIEATYNFTSIDPVNKLKQANGTCTVTLKEQLSSTRKVQFSFSPESWKSTVAKEVESVVTTPTRIEIAAEFHKTMASDFE